ncbi:hypothetical protein [Amycolatopsis sp. AA4]|uniref:hypothetical protein n=2 Tax=Actinomycetes TaxID=1760 RepID=UPI0013317671|nr:hypothetical protein [Amycolatopsis sp. AA4]
MPYGERDGGYSFTAGALEGIVARLRDGEQTLDVATSRAARGVDAGASSAVVGQAVAGIVKMGVAAAGAMGGAAANVHAASGAYDDIENSHAGQLKLNDRQDSDPDARRELHVHG